MDITWHGNSCFRIIERGMAAVVTDLTILRSLGLIMVNCGLMSLR